jgi:hypothetical protein
MCWIQHVHPMERSRLPRAILNYHLLSWTTTCYPELPRAILNYHLLSWTTTCYHELPRAILNYHLLSWTTTCYPELPRAILNYQPSRKRNQGCPLKRLLDLWKWGRNRPWGLNLWENYDDDDGFKLFHLHEGPPGHHIRCTDYGRELIGQFDSYILH